MSIMSIMSIIGIISIMSIIILIIMEPATYHGEKALELLCNVINPCSFTGANKYSSKKMRTVISLPFSHFS